MSGMYGHRGSGPSKGSLTDPQGSPSRNSPEDSQPLKREADLLGGGHSYLGDHQGNVDQGYSPRGKGMPRSGD